MVDLSNVSEFGINLHNSDIVACEIVYILLMIQINYKKVYPLREVMVIIVTKNG